MIAHQKAMNQQLCIDVQKAKARLEKLVSELKTSTKERSQLKAQKQALRLQLFDARNREIMMQAAVDKLKKRVTKVEGIEREMEEMAAKAKIEKV